MCSLCCVNQQQQKPGCASNTNLFEIIDFSALTQGKPQYYPNDIAAGSPPPSPCTPRVSTVRYACKVLNEHKKWHNEFEDMHNKMINQDNKTRARRPTIRSGSKHLDLDYTRNCLKIGKCSPYHQVAKLREKVYSRVFYLKTMLPRPLSTNRGKVTIFRFFSDTSQRRCMVCDVNRKKTHHTH